MDDHRIRHLHHEGDAPRQSPFGDDGVRTCRGCDNPVAPDSIVCPFCGEALFPSAASPSGEAAPRAGFATWEALSLLAILALCQWLARLQPLAAVQAACSLLPIYLAVRCLAWATRLGRPPAGLNACRWIGALSTLLALMLVAPLTGLRDVPPTFPFLFLSMAALGVAALLAADRILTVE